jgi:pimeloyl-ACP methyl ester carboxylesterase
MGNDLGPIPHEISPALYRAGSGEQVVLLHGLTGSWIHWRPVLAELVARYEVIAPTLAGHDGGPPLPERSNTLSGVTDWLEGHLNELGVSSAHVVGNSLGGALALELAKRGRARSVVAIAPAGGWSEGDGEAARVARFFARQLRLTRLSARYMDTVMKRPSSRRIAMRDVMRHAELVAPADAVDMARAAVRCPAAARAIQALREEHQTTVRELDRITCPVLLVSPQHDRILPAERHAQRFRREIPGVESRMLPGCGHLPMWDDTRLVVQTIAEFVDRHVTAAAGKPTAFAA